MTWEISMATFQLMLGYSIWVPIFATGAGVKEEKGQILCQKIVERMNEVFTDWEVLAAWKAMLARGKAPITVAEARELIPDKYLKAFEALLQK